MGRARIPVVTLAFCAISAAVSIWSLVQAPLDGAWRSLHAIDAFRSPDFWRLVIPATLLHSSWHHLILNLAMGLLLGAAAERRLGSRRTLAMIVVCCITLTGIELWFSGRPQIGISGIDYALLGFLLPNPPAIRYPFWPICVVILLGWLVAGVIFPISPDNPPGNASHVGGLLLGLAAGFVFRFREAHRPDVRSSAR